MYKRIILIWSVSLLGFVQGQTEMTLLDAIQKGLESNFQILIADERLMIAENNNSNGSAGFLPSLSLATSNSNALGQNNNKASFVGQLSQGNQTLNTGIRNSVDLSWRLFGGFSAWINKSKLALLEDQSVGNKEVIVENTIQAIILAYYRIQIETKRLQVNQELLALSKTRYEKVRMNADLGVAASFEVLQVQNNYYNDSANVVRQEIICLQAKSQLKSLLNIDPTEGIELTDTLVLKEESFKYEDLKNRLFENNRNLKNQFLNQMIFQKDAQIQKASRLPNINMSLGNNYNWNRFDIPGIPPNSGFDLPSIGSSSDYYVNFSLNFNLFNGHQVKRSIENAQINTLIAELTQEEMKMSLSHELYQQYKDYQAKLSLYQLNKKLLKGTKLNLKIAKDKWEQGVLNSIDYRTIENEYANAQYAYSLSMYQVLEAHTELLRLTGGLIDDMPRK